MPELPEVYTIVSDLKRNIVGFSIEKVVVSPSYPKIADKTDFSARLVRQKVKDVKRIAKNILLELENDIFILIHLAMTGRVLLFDPKALKGKKAHVVFHLKRGTDNLIMAFSDTRMFGKVALLSPDQVELLAQKYGAEPITADLDVQKLFEQFKNKKTIIKNLLMDQKSISGMGNIYVTEALFLAGIHPQTKTNAIGFERFEKLMTKAKEILEQGIKNRGSTLPDEAYVDVWGKPGTQQDYFNIYLKKVCPNCGGPVSYVKINGRGTYFCPNCQPLKKV